MKRAWLPIPRHRLYRVVTPAAVVAAVVLVVVLGVQNRSLKGRYARMVERATRPYPGMYVPAFDAVTIDGDSVRIGDAPDGAAQALFFFTTTCEYCRATLPAWRRIAQAGHESGVAAYGIQLDSAHLAPRYVTEHALRFPVIHLSDRRLLALYRVERVPLTLLVDSGRVSYARRGQIAEQVVVDSILAVLARQSSGSGEVAEEAQQEGGGASARRVR